MGLGLVVMVLVRALCSGMTDRMWAERMLVLGTVLFSGMVGAESIAPDSDLLNRVGWALFGWGSHGTELVHICF